MNATLATYLAARLVDIPWLDMYAGLVRPIRYKKGEAEFVIPISIDVQDPLACTDEELNKLIPNGNYASLLYFEDGGWAPTRDPRTRRKSYVSRLRLVCWLNTPKLGGNAFAGDLAQQDVIGALEGHVLVAGPYQGLMVRVAGSPVKNGSIFAQYTYREAERQYLNYPYDYFAIDLECSFRIKPGCEDDLLKGDVSCWVPPSMSIRRHPKDFTCEELLDPTNGLTEEQLGPECLNCTGTPTVCDGVDIRDSDGNLIEHIDDGGTYIVMPTYIYYANEAAALADAVTVPTVQQRVVLQDSGREYRSTNGTDDVATIVAAKVFLLPVTETTKGINATVVGTLVGIELVDPT